MAGMSPEATALKMSGCAKLRKSHEALAKLAEQLDEEKATRLRRMNAQVLVLKCSIESLLEAE